MLHVSIVMAGRMGQEKAESKGAVKVVLKVCMMGVLLVRCQPKGLTVCNDHSTTYLTCKEKLWALTKMQEPAQKHKLTSYVRRKSY